MPMKAEWPYLPYPHETSSWTRCNYELSLTWPQPISRTHNPLVTMTDSRPLKNLSLETIGEPGLRAVSGAWRHSLNKLLLSLLQTFVCVSFGLHYTQANEPIFPVGLIPEEQEKGGG